MGFASQLPPPAWTDRAARSYRIHMPHDLTVVIACETAGCDQWRTGWETVCDELSKEGALVAAWIRSGQSGRTFRELAAVAGFYQPAPSSGSTPASGASPSTGRGRGGCSSTRAAVPSASTLTSASWRRTTPSMSAAWPHSKREGDREQDLGPRGQNRRWATAGPTLPRTISNDVTEFSMSTPVALQDITGVDKSAHERLALLSGPDVPAERHIQHRVEHGRTQCCRR